ncbi:MAG: protoporphyrinogen oxidase [Myxococcales bacterium]|nr:protoporphyrinogen oxidase [Myxococcales bacterium]
MSIARTRIAVLFATKEGQTRKIGDYVAARLRDSGAEVDVEDVAHLPEGYSLAGYAGALLAASIHMGKHEGAMVKFVKHHHAELASIPTAFLSFSLSEAGVERPGTPPEQRKSSEGDVRKIMDAFFAETGWSPTRQRPVAGALRYSQYGFVMRFVMRRIAKKTGGGTDTSRDYEYTDWAALGQFVDDFGLELLGPPKPSDGRPRAAHVWPV